MHEDLLYLKAFLIALIVTLAVTPVVKLLAIKFNIVDTPDGRKVHSDAKPYLGGVSIILGFLAGYFFLHRSPEFIWTAYLVGAGIIATVGFIDDKYSLGPKAKLAGQSAAAIVLISSGILINDIQVPIIGNVDFGFWAYPITLLWIVGFTNAINLIDGLDGLATGVSSIALVSIIITAFLTGNFMAIGVAVALLGGTIGFLFFNFHPARIFMGDTGSLFIGYTLAVISSVGMFKFTIFTLMIPMVILAVPLFDTLFAIVRRMASGQKISVPDKAHLHHRLMDIGFSHRTTVLIIYGLCAFFGIAGIVFSRSVIWGSLLLFILSALLIQFSTEMVDVLNKRKKPLLTIVKRFLLLNESTRGK